MKRELTDQERPRVFLALTFNARRNPSRGFAASPSACRHARGSCCALGESGRSRRGRGTGLLHAEARRGSFLRAAPRLGRDTRSLCYLRGRDRRRRRDGSLGCTCRRWDHLVEALSLVPEEEDRGWKAGRDGVVGLLAVVGDRARWRWVACGPCLDCPDATEAACCCLEAVAVLSCHRSDEGEAPDLCRSQARWGSRCHRSEDLEDSTRRDPCQQCHLQELAADSSSSPVLCDENPVRGYLDTWGGLRVLPVKERF